MPAYDCLKCPGFCCSYPVIQVSKRDLARLARHFAMTEQEAESHFCKSAHGYKRVMRRKSDEHFGRICRFFDSKLRRCSIYEARPDTCRSYPDSNRCGYWDFLKFERNHQDDPEHVARTDSQDWQ